MRIINDGNVLGWVNFRFLRGGDGFRVNGVFYIKCQPGAAGEHPTLGDYNAFTPENGQCTVFDNETLVLPKPGATIHY